MPNLVRSLGVFTEKNVGTKIQKKIQNILCLNWSAANLGSKHVDVSAVSKLVTTT
jgi:hypothetical protein